MKNILLSSSNFHFVQKHEWVSEVVKSCPTLCNPMNCSLQGSSDHEIFQARVLEWAAISSCGGSSRHRDQTRTPALQADALLSEPPGKSKAYTKHIIKSWRRIIYIFQLILSLIWLGPKLIWKLHWIDWKWVHTHINTHTHTHTHTITSNGLISENYQLKVSNMGTVK